MRVRVRLFAFMAQVAQTRQLEMELPPGGTCRDVERELRTRMPHLRWPGNVMWAVNQEYVGAGASGVSPGLKDGDEVAIIPPVSGG